MIGIRAQTVANQLAVNGRVSLFRALEFLNHHNASAFANDKTVPIPVPGTRGPSRLVVARAQRFHGTEAGQTNWNNGRFRAAGEKDIGLAKFDHAPRFSDRVV